MTFLTWEPGQRGIEWTGIPGHHGMTWNPTVGCTRVSPGCDNCYAFQIHDERYARNLQDARAISARLSKPLPPHPLVTAAEMRQRGLGAELTFPQQYDTPFSTVQLLPQRLKLPNWQIPRAVFVDSMADLFHEDVPDQYLDLVWDAMESRPESIFMILTKRPERMRDYLRAREARGVVVAQNVWLGTSVENVEQARIRIPILREVLAAKRFLSCEPLLEGIELLDIWGPCPRCAGTMSIPFAGGGVACPDCLEPYQGQRPEIDWVIIGGESGGRARTFETDWARRLIAECRRADVAVFMEQLGENPVTQYEREQHRLEGVTGHGGQMAQWPDDLRVREFPIRIDE